MRRKSVQTFFYIFASTLNPTRYPNRKERKRNSEVWENPEATKKYIIFQQKNFSYVNWINICCCCCLFRLYLNAISMGKYKNESLWKYFHINHHTTNKHRSIFILKKGLMVLTERKEKNDNRKKEIKKKKICSRKNEQKNKNEKLLNK